MITLCRTARFSAAHCFARPGRPLADNRSEFGESADAGIHGHDYVVRVTLRGEPDERTGMIVNITELKRIIRDVVTDPLDGGFLSPDHPLLGGKLPGTEVLAAQLFLLVSEQVRAAALPAEPREVTVAESRFLRAACTREEPEGEASVTLTRTYEFAAAHRLHQPGLSESENEALYGKCNNPYGHGHNYVLEVTVTGNPDPRTGLIVDLGRLDRVVLDRVVERYDHHHLNLDVPEFADRVPTTENLVKVIWERLAPALEGIALLKTVTVHETERNTFSYSG